LHYYRRVIALRHDEPVVADGDFTMLLGQHEQVYAFTRRLGAVELLVIANMSSGPAVVDQASELAGWSGTEVVLSNVEDASPDWATFAPWQVRVHRRTR
jgi:oligo-1,6-glucosidase